jgi:hypothetical protein
MASANRAQDLANDLSPEEEAARYQEFQQFYADQAVQNQAKAAAQAAADKAKAEGRDPALATLLQQLGADNEATRAISGALYDKYGLTSLADLGRGEAITVADEYTDPGDSGSSLQRAGYTYNPFINKNTGQQIGDLGFVDKDKVGTTKFYLNPDGTIGSEFTKRSHGLWDQGLGTLLNMVGLTIPGASFITAPITAGRAALNEDWGKAALSALPMIAEATGLTGALKDIVGLNTPAINSADQLLGGAQTDSLDFNPGVVDATPLYDSLGYDWLTDPNAITFDAMGNPVLPADPNAAIIDMSGNQFGELARGPLTGSSALDLDVPVTSEVGASTRSLAPSNNVTLDGLDADIPVYDSLLTPQGNYIDQQGVISNNVTTNASSSPLLESLGHDWSPDLDGLLDFDKLGSNEIDQLGLTNLSAADRAAMFNTADSLLTPLDIAKKVGNLALDTALEYPLTTLGIASALAGSSSSGTTNDTTAEPARRTYTYGEIPVIGPTQGIKQLQEASANVYGSGPFRQSSAPTGGMSFAAPSMGQQYRPLDQYNPLSLLGGQAPGGQLNLPVNFSPMGVPQNITLEELIQSQRG